MTGGPTRTGFAHGTGETGDAAFSLAIAVIEAHRADAGISTSELPSDAQSQMGYVKPRAVISWSPKPHHDLLLRLEKTVDQLSFDSFAASASFSTNTFGVGNSTIRPQQTFQSYARYEMRGETAINMIERSLRHGAIETGVGRPS